MGKHLFVVGSITYAIKGRDILSENGIHSYVERTPRGSKSCGCGFSIYVPNDSDKAEKILEASGINIAECAKGGGV